MKKIIGIVYVFVSFTGLYSQDKPESAPLNPLFIEYMELPREQRLKKSSIGKGLGYFPSYYNFHFNTIHVEEENKKNATSIPEKFDLRSVGFFGYVTPVKDQGPLGACWSFSTMAAIESNWLLNGYGEHDLSEENMATCHGFTWGIDDGGNDYIALAYLTRLGGPVTEASDPYSFNPEATCKTNGLVVPGYITNAIFLPKDLSIIKKAVMKYGGISASMYTGGTAINNYYNPQSKTFYYDGTTPPDHAVLLVGWDDAMPIAGKGLTGAWIVKNSWGTAFGDAGYFYISYSDTRFLTSASTFPGRLELDEIDTLHLYDHLGATSAYGFRQESAYGLAKYHAVEEEFIRRVGTFINSTGSVIDIEIYKNFQGDTLLTEMIASSYGNLVRYPGYQTFDIATKVSGDYYVKVKYHTPGYTYPVPVEAEIVYQGEAFALPFIEPSGKHWISRNSETWLPLGSDIPDYEADLCIRVYADRNTTMNAFFTTDKTYTCIGSPVIFTDNSNGDITEYAWDFGPWATPKTANTKGPHSVTFSRQGTWDASLTVKDAKDSTKTLSKKKHVEVVSTTLDIFLPYSVKSLVRGKSLSLTAFGAETYTWSPATGLDTTKGPTVKASPNFTTTYIVQGKMGTCTGGASIRINVVQNPSNDDVCNAIHITPGGRIGPFTNVNATVEDGEPAPPEGDCNTPMEWCVEGGLQNSVWFSFYGPENGMASFVTEGFDTQIAIYKADTCDDILSDNWELVAANDDYYGEDKFFAAALDTLRLIPGQKYFLQLDGSAGGDEGSFYITFWDYAITTDPINLENDDKVKLNIFPNPGNGAFNILYESALPRDIIIKVFNLHGQIVYSGKFENINPIFRTSIDLGNTLPGYYVMELYDGVQRARKSLIVR